MAAVGADLMVETIRGLQARAIHSRPQDHSKATLAPILKKEDGLIDFHRSAHEVVNRLRGFQPWPGAYTSFRGKNLQIWLARAVERSLAEGEITVDSGHLIVGCGAGSALELLEVQMEGKKRMPAADFAHGYRPKSGEKLGSVS
jgi:methionyl-tRNA formyltransferase